MNTEKIHSSEPIKYVEALRRAGHYRDFLKTVLDERIAHNPRYSMRALARDIKISPSRLSQILQGKQGISRDVAQQISKSLQLSEEEEQLFILLAASSDARNKKVREEAKIKIKTIAVGEENFSEVTGDETLMLEHPSHFILYELLSTGKVRNDVSWLALKMGRSIEQTRQSLDLLQRLGLLRFRNGRYVPTHREFTTSDGVSSKTIREFNKLVIGDALNAIDNQDVSERNISTLTVGINKKDLPKFNALITAFRRNLNELAKDSLTHSGEKADEVYCLAVQFFRATQSVPDDS